MLTHYFIIAAVLLAALLLSLWRLFRQKRLAGRTVLLLILLAPRPSAARWDFTVT